MKIVHLLPVIFVWVALISAQSNTVDQIVHDFPILDETGTHWIIYDAADPQNRWTDEDDPAALTIQFGTGIFWSSDVGLNFPPPTPAPGDTLVVIGSWDPEFAANPGTYGDNANHKGYYWLYSDTLDSYTDNHWRDDTLRPLPKPAVAGGHHYDSVEVSIKNPAETRYPGQTVYDVAGFDLWLDTTGTGTPNGFDVHIGFFEPLGTAGQYTLIKYRPGDHLSPGTYDTYHAYRLVARPEFINDQEPGHMTYYLSDNSLYLQISVDIGIAEYENIKPTKFALYAIPSIAGDHTAIKYALPKTASVRISIRNASGQLVMILVDETKLAGEHTAMFDGSALPSGVYFLKFEVGDFTSTEKLILLR